LTRLIANQVFVCTDPYSVLKCFADLARPPSNNFKGDPFVPVRAVPIDTFPHTNNFTMLFLFVRVTMNDLGSII
jgi:tRNA (uracil-5-)-methyltransferase